MDHVTRPAVVREADVSWEILWVFPTDTFAEIRYHYEE